MTAKIIDGKTVAENVKEKVRLDALNFAEKYGRKPGLAVIMVGENPASAIYVRNKAIACAKCEINSLEYKLPESSTEKEVIALVKSVANDKNVDGMIVQLPLPDGFDEKKILSYVPAEKDADGFSSLNAGDLLLGNDCLSACTPQGIIELIKSTGTDICGKRAVVVGRSNIVGKPVALMLLANDATVTVCHSKTQNLASVTREADILVVAIGKKEFITGDMIKPGAVVIDVGMNRDNGKLYGDVEFSSASEVASFITPVPGGVGPMTVAMLLKNTMKAACRAK
ncbi:MAG: bifunctional methylenetetrahydrofolate dehydrogenase/methenyltetrahydrofolate cyclohydrolase FolD [Firmicutes bacterium]|nr:bifunctional methylenetetrahydrofolate dehydrogenase/methenyltetrahydrofolate cyclohydrolase FolD [Bacillota bacterium]MDY5531152.1 bifunctional methylenetetrahydrofolate dehydrogenase/methenyltetrahydrofolate cyclohydrolase FolD [Pumilibacteraceae bacterium]